MTAPKIDDKASLLTPTKVGSGTSLFGLLLGAKIGIVGIFGGISGALPVAAVLGAAGYGGKKLYDLHQENKRLKREILEQPKL